MDALTMDLRIALRTLRRARSLSLAVIVTLVLATGASLAAFAMAEAALITPPPFPRADRLVMVYTTHATPTRGSERLRWSFARFRLLEGTLHSVEHIGSYGLASVNLAGAGEAEAVRAEPVGGGYFAALGVAPRRGRLFSQDEDTRPGLGPVAIIGHALWLRDFGADPGVIGRVVRVNSRSVTVIGVMPAGFAGLTGRAELWFPSVQAPRLTYPGYLTTNQDFISVVARLRPGVTLEAARADVEAVGASIQSVLPSDQDEPGDSYGATIVPLADVRITPNTRRSMLILLAAGVLVLVLGCANVTSLLVAHAGRRRREMAVRLALGAPRERLVRQLLTETALLAVAGTVVGLLAAWGVVSAWHTPVGVISAGNQYGSVGEFIQPRLDPMLLGVTVAVMVMTTLGCGLAPALTAARAGIASTLREGGGTTRTTRSGVSVRGFAVATEVALAVVLLTGGALMLATIARLRGEHLGFDPRNVIVFSLRAPEARYPAEAAPAFVGRLLESLARVPGVAFATVDGCAPLEGSCANSTLHILGRPQARPGGAPFIMRHYVGPDHLLTLGIPLVAGRAFTDADRGDAPPVAIVSELAARRFWPGENPIGARIWFGGGSRWMSPDSSVEVVGVAGDVAYQAGEERRWLPAVYTPAAQFTYASRSVMVRTRGDPAPVLRGVRDAVRQVDPELALYDLGLLVDQLGDAWARQRYTTTVLAGFAAIALALAATGVFGVVSNLVAERTREIGIRLALGATPADVRRLVLVKGMAMPILGLVAGTILTVPATRTLRALLYGVSPTDPRAFSVVVVTLAIVALTAALVPAARAARVDPRISLLDDTNAD